MKITIGKHGTKNVSLDVDRLISTRLLIQANSGKGKSWLIRLLAEQLFGKVQVIIIDVEGEFASLREKFGYVLVGKGGNTPADVRSAEKLAQTLLELRASAVCDIYEMKPTQRHSWVKLFLDALIDAPKNLWHPTVVIVDEAHVFCPEKGSGESEASEAMISLATRGRKRGYCAVFATQRLGKLRKDAAAELVNVMIGGTFIDVDRKRAADTLGVYGKDVPEFFNEVRLLERGYFFALGPAISTERLLVKVGDVETTHPEAGSSKHAAEPPPDPAAIAKFLPKLAELPKAAEEQAKTVAEMKTEIRSLKAQLRSRPAGKPVEVKVPDQKLIDRAVAATSQAFKGDLNLLQRRISEQRAVLDKLSKIAGSEAARALPTIKDLPGPQRQIHASSGNKQPIVQGQAGIYVSPKYIPLKYNPPKSVPAPARAAPREVPAEGESGKLKAGAVKMLETLAQWHPDPRTRDQLGALAGFAPEGGTFGEYMRVLGRNGYITENGDGVHITEAGLATLTTIPARPDSADELIALWKSKFKSGVGKMLDVLVRHYPEYISQEQLGEESGFASGGGTFGEYLRVLRRSTLIEERSGEVRVAENLMEV